MGLEPIELAPKEALALISANGVTLGRGSLVLHDVADLVDMLQVAAALSLEGFAGNLSIIHPAPSRLEPQLGFSTAAAAACASCWTGSYLWEPGAARNLQDPLSFRCAPAKPRRSLRRPRLRALEPRGRAQRRQRQPARARRRRRRSSRSATSTSSGSAMAFDLLRLAIANAIKVANERVQKLLWNHFSGLPERARLRAGPDQRPQADGPLVRRARRRGPLARQAGVARLRRAGGRGRRGRRQHGAPCRCAAPTSSCPSCIARSPTS